MNIEQQIYMSYNDFVNHLIRKYGSVPYDYFCNENCASEQRKNSRTEDGLVIHHIDECSIANLSNRNTAKNYSFDYQKSYRLVYCNLLEHFLLHIKIVKEFNHINNTVGFGGLASISSQINEYFSNPPTVSKWQINLYNAIKNDYNNYCMLLKEAINIVNSCANNSSFKPIELFYNMVMPNVIAKSILDDVKKFGITAAHLYPYIGDKVELRNLQGVDSGTIIAIKLRNVEDSIPDLIVKLDSNRTVSISSGFSLLINVKEKTSLTLCNAKRELCYPGDNVVIDGETLKITSVEILKNNDLLITSMQNDGTTIYYKNNFKNQVILANTHIQSTKQALFPIGAKVKHVKFGNGIILSSQKLGNDILYEIDFGNGNVKRLMASYANLEKQ